MNKRLHIAIVANTAFNLYNFRLGLLKMLIEEGHHVFAIAPADGYEQLLLKEGIQFIPLQHLSRKGTNPFEDIQLINELRKLYKTHQLDVVLQYTIKPNIYGALATWFTKTKAICTVTGLGYTFLNKSLASSVARYLYRLAFTSAHKILFQNEDDLKVFVENGLVKKSKTLIVPGSGIDIKQFNPDFCKEDKSNQITRFLMIGRLLKDKGVYEYINAAKIILSRYNSVEFHLLGDIDDENPAAIKQEELQQWIKAGIIHYHPHALDIRLHICLADCIVLPSYREGLPRVILEGMAMGKPCITSDVPGCRDAVVDGQQGFLCKSKDSEALVSACTRFLEADEIYINKLCVSARKRVEEKFSKETINAIYSQLLKKLN